jgi:L-ascorbate metabolism protein UlaG (beta-lactamase superfamily)
MATNRTKGSICKLMWLCVNLLNNYWYGTIQFGRGQQVPARTYVREQKPMEISWLGHSCFQLRGKNVILMTDPFPPPSPIVLGEGARQGKSNASIITVSHNHSMHSYVERVAGHPRVVRGPGEYEISDVLITGVASFHDEQRGQVHGRNTIYIIHMDDLVICHLGDLGHTLQENQLEEVADADILFVPIGGGNTLSPTQAAEVISQVEPRIVIPMHYAATSTGEVSSELTKFCREMGVETIEPQPKLLVTRNSLPLEMQIVLLSMR